MESSLLSSITSSITAGGMKIFTAEGVATHSQCAAMSYVSIRHTGLVVHAMPKIEFPMDLVAGFGFDYAQLSFSVDFLGCYVDSFTQTIEWNEVDCNIDTIFHKMDWNQRPSLYGKMQADGSVEWHVQGTGVISSIENRRVTNEAVNAIVKAMSKNDRMAFLRAIFDQVRDYIEVPSANQSA